MAHKLHFAGWTKITEQITVNFLHCNPTNHLRKSCSAVLFNVLHFKSRLCLIRHGCKLQSLDSGFFNKHFESSEVCITKLLVFFSPRLLHGKAPAVRFGSNLEFWFSSIFVSNVLNFAVFTACHKPPLLNMRIVKTCRRLGSN